ncbi:MAG: hypothetical protein IIT84_03105 [Oscillospiraceae bacterium]|nr:hypothetical protein [Oscillospiraceae bacterium]
MNYYLMGIWVGIIIGLAIYLITRKTTEDYDERQLVIRGKAYKVGFLSTLGAGAVYGFISTVLKRPLAEDGIAVFFILLFGVGVFVVYCIMNDAFFSISDKIKPVHLVVLLLLGVVSQGYMIYTNLTEGTIVGKNGELTARVLPFGILLLFLCVLAALAVKLIKSRKESEDE